MYRATSSSNCIRSLRLLYSFFTAKNFLVKCVSPKYLCVGGYVSLLCFFFPPCFFFNQCPPWFPPKKFTPNESQKRWHFFETVHVLLSHRKAEKWSFQSKFHAPRRNFFHLPLWHFFFFLSEICHLFVFAFPSVIFFSKKSSSSFIFFFSKKFSICHLFFTKKFSICHLFFSKKVFNLSSLLFFWKKFFNKRIWHERKAKTYIYSAYTGLHLFIIHNKILKNTPGSKNEGHSIHIIEHSTRNSIHIPYTGKNTMYTHYTGK